jgi:hypothetical protein
MPLRLLVRLLAFVFVVFWLGRADAEPSQADKTKARQLLDDGDALVEQNDFAQALAKYEAAHAIMGVPTTGIEVSRTLARLGRLVAARQSAQAVVALPSQPNEPTPFVEARAEAAKLVKDLAGRIPSLQVTFEGLPEGSGARVFVDGNEVATRDLTGPFPIDPGKHRVEARAGNQTKDASVELTEGEQKTLTLRFEETSSARPSQTNGKKPSGGSGKRTAGYVVGGIGVAGLVVAGVTGVIIVSRHGKIKDDCPNEQCNDEGFDLVEKNRSLLVVNAIAWGVGVVGTGVGAYLILSSKPDSETSAGFTPLPGGGSLAFRRRF